MRCIKSQNLIIVVKVYYYKNDVSVAIYFKKCNIYRRELTN